MFPEIALTESGLKIYTFGILLSISILLFLWMLRKVCRAIEKKPQFFFNNLIWYFLSTFFFTRLFHVIFYWGIPGKASFSLSYPFLSFFTMSDFYFSLIGAMFGFTLVLFWSLRGIEDERRKKSYDAVLLAFLFAAIFGYIGAFLGGQTYGIESRGALSVDYSRSNPFLGNYPRFPLAIVYAVITGVIFSFCYIFRKAHKEDGVTAFLGIGLFGIMLFLGEFWNAASQDNLSSLFGLLINWRLLNINQIGALALIYWSAHHLVMELDLPVGDTAKKILRIQPPKKVIKKTPVKKVPAKKTTKTATKKTQTTQKKKS